jgi:hypothetical protein
VQSQLVELGYHGSSNLLYLISIRQVALIPGKKCMLSAHFFFLFFKKRRICMLSC